MGGPILLVDVGSTFTKALLVDADSGEVLGTGSHRTTVDTDVLDGYAALRAGLAGLGDPAAVLACSSAGGGLRLAVVGYEREVTAHAGRRVGLSAGARVVHVSAGPMSGADVRALRAARPDIILLVGGTDGGNAQTLLHNASRLAKARVATPVVVAGNADAADDVAGTLAATDRRFVVTENVLPRIGVIAPTGARTAIRETFLRHVIGGKGLSRGPAFGRLVRAATPDAVLTGVQVLAEVARAGVLVVDIGGATTDVYSVLDVGTGSKRRDVVGQLQQARTVEADLGMRWNALGVVEAAAAERVALSAEAERYAAHVAADVAHVPAGPAETALELELATAAAVVAVRRHARPQAPSEGPRPLHDVTRVLGSGGVLRHSAPALATRALDTVVTDHAGGWRTPRHAVTGVDTAYVLFAVGLLAEAEPGLARWLAASV